jgi:FKBP-type peptidyl-prolyl cis-trans isomerase FkpA
VDAAPPAAAAIVVPPGRRPAGPAPAGPGLRPGRLLGVTSTPPPSRPAPTRYHPALVKHPSLLQGAGLAACASLLLLSGCGTSDSGAGTGGQVPATSSESVPASASGTGNCASVAPRTDDFHQKVDLTTTTADGLKYGDIQPGSGAQAASGEHITMQYTGWLQDGTSFDSSRKSGGQPFPFTLGAGQVIRGWDEGIAGMRLGGVRRLVIPPALGYGASGQPSVIPPNATLTFDVQLLCIG